jgi:glycosyltransferase involved in cell wall biosynthesis
LRIAYLSPSGNFGGAETSLREILGSVRAAAPECELWLVLGQDGPLADYARGLGVEVVVAPFPAALAALGDSHQRGLAATLAGMARAAWQVYSYRSRLASLLRSVQPDIIHSNGLKMHVLSALARPGKAHLIWHIHDYVSARGAMRLLLPRLRGACSLAIANSNSVSEDVRKLLPGLKTTVVYNAVNVDKYSPSGPKLDLDALAGLAPANAGTIRVGLVATFARWKGHKVFLDAVSRLSPEIPVRAYVVGGAIYQTGGSQWSIEELRREAQRLGLGNRIGFTGFVADTDAVMRSLDIVVHASTQPEPFGMVIIEAMACGKPVIASQAGGAAELIVDGQNALGHAPGDAEGLVRQMERLCQSAALRESLGKSGRRGAEQFFARPRIAAELLAVYRSIGTQEHASVRPRASVPAIGD